jgi:hypothetical protein
MRRPWIKIEACTPDKPEICAIATQLKMDEDMVMGKLVRLWSWVTVNHVKSDDLSVTKEFIDKLVARKGFAEAMIKAGWLQERGERLLLPNFERHHSDAAKTRALTAVRVARHRALKEVKGGVKSSRAKVTIKSLEDKKGDAAGEEALNEASAPWESNAILTNSETLAPATESVEVVAEPVTELVECLEPEQVEGGEAEEPVGQVEPISINAEPTFRPLHIDSPAAVLQDVPSEYVPVDEVDQAPEPAESVEELKPSPAQVPEPVKTPDAKAETPSKKGRKKQEADDAQAMLF